VLGVVTLLLFSIFYLKSLCLLCSGYYVFSLASFALFWKYSRDDRPLRWLRFSPRFAATFAVLAFAGAWSFHVFHDAKKQAQSGDVARRIVRQYYALPEVKTPSLVSPYWIARSTPRFEDAPIHIVEYADFLCSDCLYMHAQLDRLKEEFKGKINIAFQFFPLEAKCNNVVAKDKHPGACDIAFIAAQDPARFPQIHDEIFANFQQAKKPEWRAALARRYGIENALTDTHTREVVQAIIQTGAEYERTSDKFEHGIRSTPTLIVNNRMIIGTFPYEHLRAIFQAIADQREPRTFLENWEDTGK
jgi:protein-disulfide isomerase